MTTHAIAKLYHYTKHLNLCMMQCNACCKCEMILGAVIPTWSPVGKNLRQGGSLRTDRVQFSS